MTHPGKKKLSHVSQEIAKLLRSIGVRRGKPYRPQKGMYGQASLNGVWRNCAKHAHAKAEKVPSLSRHIRPTSAKVFPRFFRQKGLQLNTSAPSLKLAKRRPARNKVTMKNTNDSLKRRMMTVTWRGQGCVRVKHQVMVTNCDKLRLTC